LTLIIVGILSGMLGICVWILTEPKPELSPPVTAGPEKPPQGVSQTQSQTQSTVNSPGSIIAGRDVIIQNPLPRPGKAKPPVSEISETIQSLVVEGRLTCKPKPSFIYRPDYHGGWHTLSCVLTAK
jgi:hypothetical protein